MDVFVTEEQIRTLAFNLWEKAGCPDGRSEEYWEQAREQLSAGAGTEGEPSDGTSAESSSSQSIDREGASEREKESLR
ncbi:DUF2934 domain-containing protein [Paraburkholderia sp. IW21]|uniref:DUF2934 domain-containing protein n=1 Tax=Paraburkholderia sp. IW21 TaxID=3242488 RepID=UPI0035220E81